MSLWPWSNTFFSEASERLDRTSTNWVVQIEGLGTREPEISVALKLNLCIFRQCSNPRHYLGANKTGWHIIKTCINPFFFPGFCAFFRESTERQTSVGKALE